MVKMGQNGPQLFEIVHMVLNSSKLSNIYQYCQHDQRKVQVGTICPNMVQMVQIGPKVVKNGPIWSNFVYYFFSK